MSSINKEIIKPAMSEEMAAELESREIMAVLVIEKLEQTIPTINALRKGGVTAIELALRTPCAFQAAKLIKKEAPDFLLGLGTVLTKEQVAEGVEIGADFAVAPGCNPEVIDEARRLGLPFAPGVMTPSDLEVAISHGCKVVKYFPAESAGSLKHLNSMVAPYKYLGIKFIPLGGCNKDNAADYYKNSLISIIGGSWLAKSNLIINEQWDKITENCVEIMTLIHKVRGLKCNRKIA